MRRVAIIGCGGAGKTTLARELGPLLDVPVLHVDALHWREAETASEGWPVLHEQLVAGEVWVFDGMKPGMLTARLERADTVVFLDLPRRTCLRGVVERRLRFGRRPRPELGRADRITWPYLRWVWRFSRDVRPRVLEALAASTCDVVVLRSRREIDAYVARVRTEPVSPVSGEVTPGAVALP